MNIIVVNMIFNLKHQDDIHANHDEYEEHAFGSEVEINALLLWQRQVAIKVKKKHFC